MYQERLEERYDIAEYIFDIFSERVGLEDLKLEDNRLYLLITKTTSSRDSEVKCCAKVIYVGSAKEQGDGAGRIMEYGLAGKTITGLVVRAI